MGGLSITQLAQSSLLATGTGAITAAAGQYGAGMATSRTASYQAALAQQNAQIARQYAATEIQKGAVEEQTARQGTAQKIGAVRAAGGASGVDVGTGSMVQAQADTAATGELDALTIRNNAARAAFGYNVQATGFENQADLEQRAARNARSGAVLSAFSSVISGAGAVSEKWARFRQAGIKPWGLGDNSTSNTPLGLGDNSTSNTPFGP